MEEHRFGLDESTTCDQKQTNPEEFKCLVQHACQCRDANCQRPRCQKMKEFVQHVRSCKQKSTTGCKICKGLFEMCLLHEKNCQNRKCPVQFCIKKRDKMLQARLQQAQILKRRIATKQNRQMSDAVLQTSPGTSSQPSPSARPHTSPHPPQPDASTQTKAEVKEARVNDKQSSEERGIENKVLEDMGKLFESGKRSDVTVQVKDSEFKVHSSILCARSPVLSAMLEHDTAERASDRITINDCDADVFKEYLRYLYTGSVRSLTRRTVFGLYRVADKYLASDLKLLCLEHVRGMLCVQTFCETVKLALTHREYDLLRLAVDFAAHNIQSILRSVEWQIFICEYPKVANEILIKSVRPQIWTAMEVDDDA